MKIKLKSQSNSRQRLRKLQTELQKRVADIDSDNPDYNITDMEILSDRNHPQQSSSLDEKVVEIKIRVTLEKDNTEYKPSAAIRRKIMKARRK